MSSLTVFPRCSVPRYRNIIAASISSDSGGFSVSTIYQQKLKRDGLTYWSQMPDESWRGLATFANLLHLSIQLSEIELAVRDRTSRSVR